MGISDRSFAIVSPEKITDNVFKLIGADWMLLTAGSLKAYNTMTASWGGLGVLWGKQVAWCVVRPQRHTFGFMENNPFFTMSFFDEKYRKALEFCGANSGKNVDKAKATGLTPLESDLTAVYFDEARLVLECRKLYFQDLDPHHFLDPGINDNYPLKDYHRMYIGEIVRCLKK
jgi:flavin reductase (DIM6/NTAB) family NADH-FMN oxidoreductase RutF